MKGQSRVDEFAFVLLAGIIMIVVFAVAFSTLQQGPISGSLSTSTLNIAQGNSATVTLALNGTGYNISLSGSGEIADWLSFDQNYFDLSGTRIVTVTILVPSNADFRVHTGDIVIASSGAANNVTVPMSVNVGLVTVTNVPKSIRLGSFTISNLVGSETESEQDNIDVNKGYFSESSFSTTVTIPDNRMNILTDGYIQIFVQTSNTDGNLLVDFNGQNVYSDKISTGLISIPINSSLIQKYNSISVHADNPGVLFWESNDYKLAFVKFGIDYSGISSEQLNFTLDQTDLSSFQLGTLTFQLTNYNPSALYPLQVQINGATLYNDIPTLTYFSKAFGSEIPLFVGNNTISFSASQGASYQLSNVILTIVHHV